MSNIFNNPQQPTLQNNLFDNPRRGRNFYGGAPLPKNDPYQAIKNYEDRLQLSGLEPPEPEKEDNLLFRVLDIIDRPRQGVVNTLGSFFLEPASKNPLNQLTTAFKQGWQGKGKYKYMSELLPEAHTTGGKAAKAVAGFVGDVALDPLSWTTMGTASVAKSVGSKSIKKVLKQNAIKGLNGTPKNKVLKDIAKYTNKDVKQQITSSDFAKTLQELLDSKKTQEETLQRLRKQRSGVQKHVLPNYGKEFNKLNSVERSQLFTRLERVLSSHKNLTTRDYNSLDMLFNLAEAVPKHEFTTSNPYVMKVLTPQAQNILTRKGLTLEEVHDMATSLRNKKANILNKIPEETRSIAEKLTLPQLEAATTIANALGTRVKNIRKIYEKADKIGEKGSISKLKNLTRAEMETSKKLKKTLTEIEYVNGLSQVVDEANKIKYFKFMGKPIVEITSKLAPMSRVVDLAYNHIPYADKAIDTISGLVNPHYIKRAYKTNPEEWQQLRTAEKTITEYLRKETGLPHNALEDAVKVFDKEVLKSDKIRRAVTYYIQRNNDEWAEQAWKSWEQTLTPVEKQLVEKAATQHALLMDAIKKFDEAMGITYESDPFTYAAQFYKQSSDKVREAYQRTIGERVGSKLSHEAHFAKKKVFSSLAKANVVGGLDPVDDIVAVVALRSLASKRLALNKQLTQDLIDLGLAKLKGGKPVANWQDVTIKAYNKLHAHPEVIRQLKRLDDMFFNNETFNDFLMFTDKITNFMKTMQTSARIPFLARNIIGETLMNVFANVGLDAHEKAAKIMIDATKSRLTRVGDTVFLNGKKFATRHSDGTVEILTQPDWAGKVQPTREGVTKSRKIIAKTDEEFNDIVRKELKKMGVKTYSIGGKEYTAHELMKIFRDTGLGWSGITKGNLIKNMEDTIKDELRTVGKNASSLLVPWIGGKMVGDATETFYRLAHMIDRLDKGWDIKDMAADVRKFHVDYRDLTPVERHVLRRIAPYYTYMRKNTPIQLRLLIEKPGIIGALGRLVNQATEALGNPEKPEYLERNFAIPLYKDEKGNVRYLNWNLPVTDIGRIQFDLAGLWQENVIDMLHPGIKAAFELPESRNFSLGMPIERYEGQRKDLIPGSGDKELSAETDYLLQQLGFVNDIRDLAGKAFYPKTPTFEEEQLRPVQTPIVGSLLPLKSPRYAADSKAYAYRDQLQDYIKKLQEEGHQVLSGEDYNRLLRYGGVYQGNNIFFTPYGRNKTTNKRMLRKGTTKQSRNIFDNY